MTQVKSGSGEKAEVFGLGMKIMKTGPGSSMNQMRRRNREDFWDVPWEGHGGHMSLMEAAFSDSAGTAPALPGRGRKRCVLGDRRHRALVLRPEPSAGLSY